MPERDDEYWCRGLALLPFPAPLRYARVSMSLLVVSSQIKGSFGIPDVRACPDRCEKFPRIKSKESRKTDLLYRNFQHSFARAGLFSRAGLAQLMRACVTMWAGTTLTSASPCVL
jgi:hypothetical protein